MPYDLNKDGSKFTDLGTIPLFEKSRRFKYTGPNQLQIFNATPAQDKSGKETPVAVAQIPAGMTRAMILIAPQGPSYQCIVIPDDMATIPPGQALVMNLSPQPLGIRGNADAPFLLKQRESKLLRPGKQELLQLDVNQQEGTEWKKIRNFFLPLPATCQTMVFFLKSDSEYFRNIDGRVSKPIQTVVLRNDPKMEKAAESAAPSETAPAEEPSDEEETPQPSPAPTKASKLTPETTARAFALHCCKLDCTQRHVAPLREELSVVVRAGSRGERTGLEEGWRKSEQWRERPPDRPPDFLLIASEKVAPMEGWLLRRVAE